MTSFQRMFNAVERVPSRFEAYNKGFIESISEELQNPTTTLTTYQIQACLEVLKKFEQKGRATPAIIVAPTGAGKSGMVAMLPYALGCQKVLVLTPSRVITRQLADSFGIFDRNLSFYKTARLVDNDKHLSHFVEPGLAVYNSEDVGRMINHNLVIVNAQKFGGNAKNSLFLTTNNLVVEDVQEKFRAFDTIIVDEAHHYPAKTWTEIVSNFAGKRIVFLTGTPFDANGAPIFYKENIVVCVEREEIEGTAIRPCCFENRSGDEDDDANDVLAMADRVRGDVIKILQAQDEQEPRFVHKAMILVRKKDDARALAGALDRAGLSATWVVSDMEEKRNLEAFEGKDTRVVVVCGKLGEGYDHTPISLCVVLRKVTSRILFEQVTGRSLRMTRNLEPVTTRDQTVAKVLSYRVFDQQGNWDQRNQTAVADPVLEGEDIDE